MRAVRLAAFDAPLAAADVPEPERGAGDVTIEIRAAGICHSDAHYRAGRARVTPPLTLGHEIAGVIVCGTDNPVCAPASNTGLAGQEAADSRAQTGLSVPHTPSFVPQVGQRVAVHYLVSCGECIHCRNGGEQFCVRGAMIGKDRDGGYAERIVVPARNVVPIPDGVSFEHAAVMMCSTATAYHALRLSSLQPGESVAILGFGGLGASAAPLARILGAGLVAAIDVVGAKLALAESFGAVPIDGRGDVRAELLRLTGGRGIDVVLDLAGHPAAIATALRSLAPGGRLMLVALNSQPLDLDPYRDILAREVHIIGCSDHLLTELPELLALAKDGRLDMSRAITRRVPFDAHAINAVLDDLERGTSHLRTVIA